MKPKAFVYLTSMHYINVLKKLSCRIKKKFPVRWKLSTRRIKSQCKRQNKSRDRERENMMETSHIPSYSHTWIILKNAVKREYNQAYNKAKSRKNNEWKTTAFGMKANNRFLLCTIQARLWILHKSFRHVSGASDGRRSTTSRLVRLPTKLVFGIVLSIHRRHIVASGSALLFADVFIVE